MCQANMARSILKVGRNVFKAEKHLLLAPFYYVFERLSSHAITPTDLRHFLRLDMPLCCRNLEETEGEEAIRDSEGGPVPIGRLVDCFLRSPLKTHLITFMFPIKTHSLYSLFSVISVFLAIVIEQL
ncbi:unnamed protein product [Anisakis simplex]|uniref:Uncharacterized protein n=1 Tax=Anisakis simplex TaxID=6269 RepID=A0A0M3JX21_ANISI|nr:unnamed protein product [Anisakis simplex]